MTTGFIILRNQITQVEETALAKAADIAESALVERLWQLHNPNHETAIDGQGMVAIVGLLQARLNDVVHQLDVIHAMTDEDTPDAAKAVVETLQQTFIRLAAYAIAAAEQIDLE